MKLNWQAHCLFPTDLRHAHHNGYSILWAKTPNGRFHLGGSQYEVMPSPEGNDNIARFENRKEMITAITN